MPSRFGSSGKFGFAESTDAPAHHYHDHHYAAFDFAGAPPFAMEFSDGRLHVVGNEAESDPPFVIEMEPLVVRERTEGEKLAELFRSDIDAFNSALRQREYQNVTKPLLGLYGLMVAQGTINGMGLALSTGLQGAALSAEGAVSYYGAERAVTGFFSSRLTYETMLKFGIELSIRSPARAINYAIEGFWLDR